MIKIDWQYYITNRMWFGYWFNFSWLANPAVDFNRYEYGQWRRDDRYKWIPMVLVRKTFEADPTGWGQQYGTK